MTPSKSLGDAHARGASEEKSRRATGEPVNQAGELVVKRLSAIGRAFVS
jgi:hypothetical protein